MSEDESSIEYYENFLTSTEIDNNIEYRRRHVILTGDEIAEVFGKDFDRLDEIDRLTDEYEIEHKQVLELLTTYGEIKRLYEEGKEEDEQTQISPEEMFTTYQEYIKLREEVIQLKNNSTVTEAEVEVLRANQLKLNNLERELRPMKGTFAERLRTIINQ
jgi:hypothetical protein